MVVGQQYIVLHDLEYQEIEVALALRMIVRGVFEKKCCIA